MDLPGEYQLTIRFKLAEDTPWAKSGHVVAWEQFPMSDNPTHMLATGGESPAVKETNSEFEVSCGMIVAKVDKQTGAMTSYDLNGQELLTEPLVPNFWKHPNNNQWGSKFVKRVGIWKEAAAKRELENIESSTSERGISIQANYKLPSVEAAYQVSYLFGNGGSVQIRATYQPGSKNLPKIPRFGMKLALPESYDQVAWYGRGPHETYWDRKTGGELAVYRDSVADWNFPYIRSQDVGNRTDVRWLTMTNESGTGIKVTGSQPLSCSAWPFTLKDLEQAKHPHELPRRPLNVLHIDWKLHGVGGDNSWGAKTHAEYTLSGNEPHGFEFTLEPVAAE